ncbi:MAG: ATP-binding cassette domain-containing protein, partial [Limisphaerales bacterium]
MQIDHPEPQPLLELEKVGFAYPSMPEGAFVIKGIDLSIRRGEVIQVNGRNGSGKTTLLRLIAGELAPTVGFRRLNGGRVVYVNQHIADFLGESLTVMEQMVVGMDAHFWNSSHRVHDRAEMRVRAWLAPFNLGLEDKLSQFTSELSGGQRQIVALLSVMTGPVDVLVLDEVTAHMDRKAVE